MKGHGDGNEERGGHADQAVPGTVPLPALHDGDEQAGGRGAVPDVPDLQVREPEEDALERVRLALIPGSGRPGHTPRLS